jgi:hypothetical protein
MSAINGATSVRAATTIPIGVSPLTLGFNENPPFELEVRYWNSVDFNGFTCPSSGVDACQNLVVGSLKATF